MKKISLMLVFLFFVGCASTDDLEKLKCEISDLQVKQTQIEKVVAKQDLELQKCAANMKNCTEHCKDLSSKLDRVFKKAQQK